MKTKATKRNLRVAIAGAAVVTLLAYIAVRPQVAHATFAGANGRISFARYDPANGSTTIWTARVDGTDQQQLTPETSTVEDAHGNYYSVTNITSNWSLDGSRIAFDSDQTAGVTDGSIVDIFTIKADGTDQVQLTNNAGFNGEPNYSPDGNTTAFDSDRGEGAAGTGIYLMNASDGSSVRRVTAAPVGFFDVWPHFSPAGNRIAFTRANGCHPPHGIGPPHLGACISAVFLVNTDGSGLTQLTPWGLDAVVSDWSPDGTKLLWQATFDTLRGKTTDILLADVNGSHIVNLTNNSPLAQPCSISPATLSYEGKFSPDGTKIIFAQATNACTGQPTLWTMKPDGSNKQSTGIGVGGTFFNDAGQQGFPDWGTNQN